MTRDEFGKGLLVAQPRRSHKPRVGSPVRRRPRAHVL
jgi:hypothetical protein